MNLSASLVKIALAVFALAGCGLVAKCFTASNGSNTPSNLGTSLRGRSRILQFTPSPQFIQSPGRATPDYAQFLDAIGRTTTIQTSPQGGQTVFAPEGSMINQVNQKGLQGTIVTGPSGIAAVNSITGGLTTISAASTTGGINVNVLDGGISSVSLLNDGNIGAASVNIQEGASFDSFFNRGGGGPRLDFLDGSGNLGAIGTITSGGPKSAATLIIP